MNEVKIEYFGHACFRITYMDYSVVLDPYKDGTVPGYDSLKLKADRVLCSHDHGDHCGTENVEVSGNESERITTEFITVPHDDNNGKDRGMNRITILKCGNKKLIHYGDIGRIPTQEEYTFLKDADLIMIPCGGYYTIDAAQAKEIVEASNPGLTVLMHYRDGEKGYDVLADLTEIRNVFPEMIRIGCELTIDDDPIPNGVLVMDGERR